MYSGIKYLLLIIALSSCSLKTNNPPNNQYIGPIYKNYQKNDHKFTAFRPFYSKYENSENKQIDILWPLWMYRKYKQEEWLYAVLYLYKNKDASDDTSAWSRSFFPFYFEGRTANKEDYFALWPFHGTIGDFLSYDKVSFSLFPLYLTTNKNGRYSKYFFFPFIKHSKKGDIEQFNIFPFYMNEHSPEMNSSHYLWPIIHHGYNKNQNASWFYFFPLYGNLQSDIQNERTYLWPFFVFKDNKNFTQRNIFWPFYFYTEQTGKNAYVREGFWPFYIYKKSANYEHNYYLWPFIFNETIKRKDTTYKRKYVFPFYWHTEHRKDDTTTHFWPLYSHHKQNNIETFNLISLWPAGRDPRSLERNWSPFWQVYTYYKDPNIVKRKLLWGLVAHEKNKESSKFSIFPLIDVEDDKDDTSWSFLKGFLGQEKDGTWNFLWFF